MPNYYGGSGGTYVDSGRLQPSFVSPDTLLINAIAGKQWETPNGFPGGQGTSPGRVVLDRDVLNYLMQTKPPAPPPAQPAPKPGAGGYYGESKASPAPVASVIAGQPVAQAQAPAQAFRPMPTQVIPSAIPSAIQPASIIAGQPLPGAGPGGTGVKPDFATTMMDPNTQAILGRIAAAIGGPRSTYGQVAGTLGQAAEARLYSDYISRVIGGGIASPFNNASFVGLSPELQSKAVETGLAVAGTPSTNAVKTAQADYYQAMAEQARQPKQMTGDRFEDFGYGMKYDRWLNRVVPVKEKPGDNIQVVQEGGERVTYLKPPDATSKKDWIEIGRGPWFDPSSIIGAGQAQSSEWRLQYNDAEKAAWKLASEAYPQILQVDDSGNIQWLSFKADDVAKVTQYFKQMKANELGWRVETGVLHPAFSNSLDYSLGQGQAQTQTQAGPASEPRKAQPGERPVGQVKPYVKDGKPQYEGANEVVIDQNGVLFIKRPRAASQSAK